MDEHGDDDDYVAVRIDAANAFSSYSRQKMLQLLLPRVPMLARFVHLLYGGEAPYLVFSDQLLRGHDVSLQDNSASTLLFRS